MIGATSVIGEIVMVMNDGAATSVATTISEAGMAATARMPTPAGGIAREVGATSVLMRTATGGATEVGGVIE